MPDEQREGVLVKEWGVNWKDRFLEFDPVPIAAASIGQVHKAILQDGTRVAVKIQYPGVAKSIDSDLDNLVMMLSFGKLLPKGLYLENTIRVARKELQLECDYTREADAMIQFQEYLTESRMNNYFQVPRVFKNHSTKTILVSEFVDGHTIDGAGDYPQSIRDRLGDRLLKLCLYELFEFRFMQTDPNWSNFLYNPEKDMIYLLDFGAAREFSKEFTLDYLQLLKAGADQNRELCISQSIKLGFLTGLESQVSFLMTRIC